MTSFLGVDIPKDNIHVEFGFFISGLINLLGYEASCKIKITSNEIDIDVKMSPMEFANGLIKFHRSITDNKKGPAFTIKVGKTGLLVKAEGAACLLGIQAEAFLLITNTEFKMNLKANLFDLIEGNIILLADASQGVAAAKFRVSVYIFTRFIANHQPLSQGSSAPIMVRREGSCQNIIVVEKP